MYFKLQEEQIDEVYKIEFFHKISNKGVACDMIIVILATKYLT